MFQHLTLSVVKETRIKVLLVDDHNIVLDGLASLLQKDESFEVMGAVSSAEAAVDLLKKKQPDILLTDYSLSGMTGMELARLVKEKYPQIKVILLSMHDEAHIIKAALKQGIDGYMLKNIPQEELKGALRHVAKGLPYVSPEVTQLLMKEMNKPKEEASLLTERERDVLRLIAREYSNKEIAEELFISERTVETHRKIFSERRIPLPWWVLLNTHSKILSISNHLSHLILNIYPYQYGYHFTHTMVW